MKSPSDASRKKVTVDNLVGLGAERLAEILVSVADTRADLKRRLRMELAAEQGPGPLADEIDKRLTSFETSRGKITWRQKPAFIRDLDALRALIADRLADLDTAAATDRLWRFMNTARQTSSRFRDGGGDLQGVFTRAAGDLGELLTEDVADAYAATLVDHLLRNPRAWAAWLPTLMSKTCKPLATEALRLMMEQGGTNPGSVALVRQLADAAGDVDAYRATFSAEVLKSAPAAAELARRYLAADRIEEAGDVLRGAAAEIKAGCKPTGVDFDWETAWIDYLEQAEQLDTAQAVRWASFERTLSVDRAKAFIARLAEFDDVEAEGRAFDTAGRFEDFAAGLRFLMHWPAMVEASRMIERRGVDAEIDAEEAELWAAMLRRRYPKAAHRLLRRGAATAFRLRQFQMSKRLTAEAETIEV